jgi:hypothetical protein
MPLRLAEGFGSLRGCDFFDLRAFLGPLKLLFSVPVCGQIQKSHSLSARLVVEGMTQVIEAKLNGRDLGLRFAYPFSFELGGALRAGPNELELRHVERYTFTSRLGNIKVVPYYEFRV